MDELIKQGATAFKAGDVETARKLLAQAVRQSPDDDRAWGWMYNVCKTDQERILCLKQMLRIRPNNEKARELLENLQEQKKIPAVSTDETFENIFRPTTQKPAPGNFMKKSLDGSTSGEKKLIFALIGVALLLLIVISIIGVTSWTKQVKVKNAQTTAVAQALSVQATATAEYLQCTENFKKELPRLLSQFFRQESIADVTSRINLPEQISRLEDIRTETWNLPEKSCQPKPHAFLMDYMDKSIATYIAFSGNHDELVDSKARASIVALSKLDDEVIRSFDRGGLINLFRAKGYYYWEGLDNPNWKSGLN